MPRYFAPPNPKEPLQIQDLFNIAHYQSEFQNIKPILARIGQSVVYLFAIETCINFSVNLFTGGKLICLISKLAGALPQDKFDPPMFWWFVAKLTIIFGIIGTSLAMFNRERVVLLFQILFSENVSIVIDIERQNEVWKMIGMTSYHCGDYVIHSMWPVLFTFTMVVFKTHVQLTRESIKKGKFIQTTKT